MTPLARLLAVLGFTAACWLVVAGLVLVLVLLPPAALAGLLFAGVVVMARPMGGRS